MTRTMSPTSVGVLFAAACYFIYTLADATVKSLGDTLGIFEIGLFVTAFSLLPGVFAKPRGERWRDALKFIHPRITNGIGILRTGAAMLVTYSFVTIPLAEAYCIVFLIPVFITILSVIVLREEVSLERWALMLLSFAAVVLVVRPGFRELELGHLTALGCAICAALATTLTRMISGTERRLSLFLAPGLYTLVFNVLMLAILGYTAPDFIDLLTLLAAGLLGGVGYLFQITALAYAPANRVAPMQYSQMVWALILGAVFFAEFPDTAALVGISVLIVAGIANVLADRARARLASRWAEYRARRESSPPPPVQGPQA
jgi:drug/metabolite transporter (DMT)-like permease